MGFDPLALLLAFGGGDEEGVEIPVLALQQGLAVLQGFLGSPNHGDEVQFGWNGDGNGVGVGSWVRVRVRVRIGVGNGVEGMGRVEYQSGFGAVFDGVGGGEVALEVEEEGLAVGEGDGGDSEGEGVLEVLGVLEMVVVDVVDEGFKGVTVPFRRTVRCLNGAGEGVLIAEPELAVHKNYLVQLASRSEVSQS